MIDKSFFSDRLQEVEEYFFSKKLKQIQELNKQGHNILNLGIGSPDLPPHPSVIEALKTDAQKPNTHAYQSYIGIPKLRQAITDWYSKYYGVMNLNPNSEVLPLIGSKEGIMHLSMSILNDGDDVLIPDPGYPNYATATKLAKGNPIAYSLKKEKNWRIEKKEIEDKIRNFKVKTIWLNSPHMPTGSTMPDEDITFLIEIAKANNIMICHDNPYSFIRSTKPQSIFRFPMAKDVAIELNSLSKSHNMAGWRVGMMIGKETYLKEILKFKTNMDSGMFHAVQSASVQALSLEKNWFENLNAEYEKRSQIASQILDALQCSYDTDQKGMFLWAEIPQMQTDALTFSDDVMMKAKVFITPGSIFGKNGKRHLRISLCSKQETLKIALDRINNYFV